MSPLGLGYGRDFVEEGKPSPAHKTTGEWVREQAAAVAQEKARVDATAAAVIENAEAKASKVEQEAAKAEARRVEAEAKAARITSAIQILADEITGETIGLNEQGRVIAGNPEGLKQGFPDLKPAVKAAADAVSLKRRIEVESAADRQHAADALTSAERDRAAAAADRKETETIKAEILTLRDRMRGVMNLRCGPVLTGLANTYPKHTGKRLIMRLSRPPA